MKVFSAFYKEAYAWTVIGFNIMFCFADFWMWLTLAIISFVTSKSVPCWSLLTFSNSCRLNIFYYFSFTLLLYLNTTATFCFSDNHEFSFLWHCFLDYWYKNAWTESEVWIWSTRQDSHNRGNHFCVSGVDLNSAFLVVYIDTASSTIWGFQFIRCKRP